MRRRIALFAALCALSPLALQAAPGDKPDTGSLTGPKTQTIPPGALGGTGTGGAPAGAPANIPKPDPAAIACRKEVLEAIGKQRSAGSFRMESSLISEQGPLKMTTEYIVPDRMRQMVTAVLTQQKSETIVVGTKAWTNEGKGWSEVDSKTAGELVDQMNEALSGDNLNVGGFICRGAQMVEGKELKVYEAEEAGPKDLSPDKDKKPRNEAASYIFVDPATGLPARTTYAHRERQDKPIFKSVYTYTKDIKIEPPVK